MGKVSDLQIELEAEKGEPTEGPWESSESYACNGAHVGYHIFSLKNGKQIAEVFEAHEANTCLMAASLLLYEEAKYNDTLFNDLLALDLPLGLVQLINKRKQCNMKAITAAEIQP